MNQGRLANIKMYLYIYGVKKYRDVVYGQEMTVQAITAPGTKKEFTTV